MAKFLMSCVVLILCFSPDNSYGIYPIQVVFIVDGSDTLEESGWEKEKKWLTEVIDKETLPLARVGVVSFGTDIQVITLPYDSLTRKEKLERINAATFPGGWSNTRYALQYVLNEYEFSTEFHQKHIVLLTDGYPCTGPPEYSCPDPICHLRYRIEKLGIKVLVYNIGGGYREYLDCLVTDPAKDYIAVPTIDDLSPSLFNFDMLMPDTDGDGLPDLYEKFNKDTDGDGIDDYLDEDDDGDSILTMHEDPYNLGSPWYADSDNDHKRDYLDADDDNDGILTIDEDYDGDGDPRNDDYNNDGIPDYLDPERGNFPPVAVAGESQVVLDSATLDGSNSTDDGFIAQYTWTLVDLADPDNASVFDGEIITIPDLYNGIYSATLTVSDEDGEEDSDEVIIAAFGPAYTISEAEELIAAAVKEATAEKDRMIESLQTTNDDLLEQVTELQTQISELSEKCTKKILRLKRKLEKSKKNAEKFKDKWQRCKKKCKDRE